ncbi:hypothetical protein [Belnapia rosea]|uniref:hypothetical protein n=1 Tax=Belnapia rosea TaxID=938405 RepID=UPI000888E3B9|nr:hypothetical protein [Belnapia rosea]SDB20637.1 hypothetical protein SAMN02927895_00814 [Belnapia rosea]
MYEYRDSGGERVTLRSTRTLERLIANRQIVGETPFRLSEESDFVPAAVHPASRGVAGGVGVTLQAPATLSGGDATAQQFIDNGEPSAEAVPLPNAATHGQNDAVAEMVSPLPRVGSSPWSRGPKPVSQIDQQSFTRLTNPPEAVVPAENMTLAKQFSVASADLRELIAWHAVALFVGLIVLGIAAAIGLGSLAYVACLAGIAGTAWNRGKQIAQTGRTMSAQGMWVAGALVALACMATAGGFGVPAAAASIFGIARGARYGR